jgi:hypothetical protein
MVERCAPDPHGMVPISTPYICRMYETIHMLWMSRWVHHHATTTILVTAEFRESEDLLDCTTWASNDAKVEWLRPHTNLE